MLGFVALIERGSASTSIYRVGVLERTRLFFLGVAYGPVSFPRMVKGRPSRQHQKELKLDRMVVALEKFLDEVESIRVSE